MEDASGEKLPPHLKLPEKAIAYGVAIQIDPDASKDLSSKEIRERCKEK